ncbi:MAG: oligosaccharide flippase family protein [Anaerolineae bacterium]
MVNTVTSAGQLVAAWVVYRRKFISLTSPPSRAAHPLSPPAWGEGDGVRGESSLLPLLRRAFPFALAAVFAALQIRLSVILLERLATTAEVGYFSAASRFVEAARTIPNAFFGALFPALALLAADRLRMARTFRRSLIGLGAFGAAAGVGFSLLALPVIRLTYGDGFRACRAGASGVGLVAAVQPAARRAHALPVRARSRAARQRGQRRGDRRAGRLVSAADPGGGRGRRRAGSRPCRESGAGAAVEKSSNARLTDGSAEPTAG